MATFDFTLVLSGVSEITDELADAIYAAGCDDATLGLQNGKVYLDFSREADSIMTAIASAILAVESSNFNGLEVVEVRPPDAATIEVVNTLLGSRKNFKSHADLLNEIRQLMRRKC